MRLFHRVLFVVILISLVWPMTSVVGAASTFPGFKAPIGYSMAHAADHDPSLREVEHNWVFERGDWLSINLTENSLRLVRADGSEISDRFEIGSGIQSTVSWLGMTYDATTPEDEWMILSKQQQGTKWVFGSKEADEQLFLRLYRRTSAGEYEFSHYGIHTTPNIDIILTNGGYGSYGCILAKYDTLKFLEEMFDYSQGFGDGVRVSTYWE